MALLVLLVVALTAWAMSAIAQNDYSNRNMLGDQRLADPVLSRNSIEAY